MANDNQIGLSAFFDDSDFNDGIAAYNAAISDAVKTTDTGAGDMGDRWSSFTDEASQSFEEMASSLQQTDGDIKDSSEAMTSMAESTSKEIDESSKLNGALGSNQTTLKGTKEDTEKAEKATHEFGIAGLTASFQTDILKTSVGGLSIEIDLFQLSITAVMAVLAVIGAALAAATAGFVAFGAAAIAAVKGITDLVTNSASAADALSQLSEQTGISTDRLQELAYTGTMLDVSTETITGSMAKMIRSMSSAVKEDEAYMKAVKDAAKSGQSLADIQMGPALNGYVKLGVAIKDSNGQLRDSETVFNEVIDALGKISNPTERDAISMGIFGRSAQELNPLINAGSAAIAEYSAEAHKMGAVVDTEAIAAMDSFKDRLDSTKLALQGVGSTISMVFLPYFSSIVDGAQKALGNLAQAVSGAVGMDAMVTAVSKWFVSAAEDFAKTAPVTIQNIANTLNKQWPVLIPAIVSGLTSITEALMKIAPILFDMAIKIITILGQAIGENGPKLKPYLDEMLNAMVATLSDSAPTLIPALAEIAFQILGFLAAALLLGGIKLIEAGAASIQSFLQGLRENEAQIIEGLIGMGVGLMAGLINGISQSAKSISAMGPVIVDMLKSAVITRVSAMGESAAKLIQEFIAGLTREVRVLFSFGVMIVDTLVATVNGEIQKIIDLGASLVDGFWQGISTGWSQLVVNFQTFLDNLIKQIQDALGIHSPSTVSTEMAENFFGTFGKVGLQQIDMAKDQLQSGMVDLAATLGASIPAMRYKMEMTGSVRDVQSMAGRSGATPSSVSNSSSSTNNYLFGPRFGVDNQSSLSAILQGSI